ncbi:MAG: hypothetical protein IPO08_19705 [Xanthomonadales bacterium]|nr:hypothetical protein [Xanthomonadales bacterium]
MAAKHGELKVRWGKLDGESQLLYEWGGGGAQKPDARILMSAIEDAPGRPKERSLSEELEARGYDLTTLRFSIRQRPSTPTQEPTP